MSILGILTAIWFLNRGNKLKQTKNIEKYVWGNPKRIKDKDGYINFYSKVYFVQGVLLIACEVFFILDDYYFNLPMKTLTILFCIVFTLILIESVVIEKKGKKFTY
ncbi:hypothetical protein [Faecalimicrobium dakarense]|uniref:hypothetical protein n=1 Tax=Faecalimicrobium dakarense TaxID=1301100 RepID=UPI0004B31C4E|nr:hypothetical protein [[Clostridium] dakarense]